MGKILLYYKFVPLKDPHTVMLWQKALCQGLGLRGRIIISEHGINGTVGGEDHDIKMYMRQTKEHPAFKGMKFKVSHGSADDFPKLSVKVRDELVALGYADKLQVNEAGVIGGGKHLKPAQLHKLVEERDDVVFFDGRNANEALIGKFKDAVVPDTKTSRDFKEELASGKYDHLKDKAVVSYCTGGIRCEILSVMMRDHGFKEVYQVDGGIVKYGEAYGDEGLWEGSLRVFDGRVSTDFTSKAKIIGKCSFCNEPTKEYANCTGEGCGRTMYVVCNECLPDHRLCPDCTHTS